MRLGTKLAVGAGIGLVLANRALIGLKLRQRKDGWRRGAGLVLRDQPATYVLSAFGLDAWSDDRANRNSDRAATEAHVSARLTNFLADARECHVRVTRNGLEDRAEGCDRSTYTIAFQPWVDGCERFVRPDEWADRARDDGTRDVLNLVARIASNGACDLWFRINHVATDGVPMQEMISRLESQWGTVGPVVFPTPEEFAPHVRPRSCPSATRGDLCEMQTFVDFSPLLAWRKRMNATLSEPMPISAALKWALASQAELAKVIIGSTVDVPALKHLGRGVGVVVIRAGDYPRNAAGLAAYVREFNRQIELTRTRRNGGAKTLDACAHVPPRLASTLLRHALEHDPRAFGTMGLSILKDAKVFGAPLGDAGHADGFIAIGSVALPASDGRRVGCVTIKGPRGRVEGYPKIIRDAMDALNCEL